MWTRIGWGRREPDPDLANALADLDRLAEDHPDLKSPAETLARVLAAVFAEPPVASSFDPAPFAEGSLRETWLSGAPAFSLVSPNLLEHDLQRRAKSILKALQPDDTRAKPLAHAPISWSEWGRQWLLREQEPVTGDLASLGLDVSLATSVLHLTMLPVLAAWSECLRPIHPESWGWRPECPHCGANPTLAESRGLEGRRILRCGRCACEWAASRLGCASCGEADAKALRTLSIEGRDAHARLVACETCGFRLKVISTLSRLSAPSLLVADLASVHLDLIEENARDGPHGEDES